MMCTRAFTFITLFLIWCGLNGFNLGLHSGLLALMATIVTYLLVVKFTLIPSRIHLSYRFVLYFPWLMQEILKSSFKVIRIIWSNHSKLKPVMEWIESDQVSNVGLVIYANSITLTPGTVTLDVKGNKLLIHALEKSSIEDLRQGAMSRRVRGSTWLGQ